MRHAIYDHAPGRIDTGDQVSLRRRHDEEILDRGKSDGGSSAIRNPKSAIHQQRVAVLITGGYHTQHLTELFRQKGYSYIVLQPIVTAETNREKYEKLLLSPLKMKKPAQENQT